jgi:branched-subunit amino acid ABC-type transport system permease component
MAATPASHSPRWYGIPVRVCLITFIGTLLSFCFSLLFGIVGTLLTSFYLHLHPDMTVVYRRIAFPAACVGGVVIFTLSLVTEVRHYRRSKALSSIERMADSR